ncbi:Colicin V production protein [Fictibacillus macauensis ZFHKF-1]|uniref:Colicin V production protein n=1 Tax=Fictibacillus macauensis ZFHKF-1 TaxID=1196324 RepID=I8J0Y2_9BACL|nr:CvpA family protein [Fictibacillus macauensis]EIT85416.1 Colicin V production protein [Fictibacillus macauensis ZFHKF-1]
MLNLVIIILLVGGFLIGLRRGLIMQAVHLVGFIAAYVVAYLYFRDLAPHLKLWIPYPISDESSLSNVINNMPIEDVYYNAIAFLLLFIATKIVLHIIGSMLNFLAELPILRTINRWLGGVLGFIEVYLIVFLLLFVASLIPSGGVHDTYEKSSVGKAIVQNTPVFSDKVKELWSKRK